MRLRPPTPAATGVGHPCAAIVEHDKYVGQAGLAQPGLEMAITVGVEEDMARHRGCRGYGSGGWSGGRLRLVGSAGRWRVDGRPLGTTVDSLAMSLIGAGDGIADDFHLDAVGAYQTHAITAVV